MKVTWYGHSCCLVEGGGSKLLVDPFLTGNPSATVTEDQMAPDYIILTHGHADHYGDTTSIAKRTEATIIANFEVSNYATEKEGCPKAHPMHIGGAKEFPFGRVKLTIAHHGSSMPDGSYGGSPAGILLTIEGKTVYHAGDTGLFYDMNLIGEIGIDLAILPIGDNFTMGPEDALRAIQFLKPKQVLPVHYNTWELIEQDVEKWAEEVHKTTETQVLTIAPGGSIEL